MWDLAGLGSSERRMPPAAEVNGFCTSAAAGLIPGNRIGQLRHLRLAGTSRVFGSSHQRREEFDRAALVHVPELLRVATRLCGNLAAGEDLVQDTYLQAWRSFHRFEAGTNCRAWLYKILLFTYSAERRKRARRPFLVDIDAATEAALLVEPPTPDMLTADAVRAAFDRLPDPFRTLVVLVDVEGLSYREAADALSVPIGTVMSRLSRGRRLLRQELAAHAPDGARDHAASQGASVNTAQGRARS
jgi:RNA polymerase sigma-70 factor (ECF subfamily)